MARVDATTVQHVARLARLSIHDGERETFARQLSGILAYAESIQALDTSGAPPMEHAGASAPLREDAPQESLPRPGVLEAAPDAEAGLFRVPRILGR